MHYPLGVVVVGTGSIGSRHLRVLRQLPGVRPVAVPKRLERVAELEREGYRAVPTLDIALRQFGPSVGVVASETAQHLSDALAMLEHGLDVLIEKPLGKDADQARRVLETARARARRVYVACVLRFSDSLGTFRDLLKKIGRLHAVRIECQSYLPGWRPSRSHTSSYSAREADGGVLRDLIHEIDYAGWLYGWPAAVSAVVRNSGILGIAAEESADLLWDLPDGGVLSMRLDYLSQPARRRMTAFGDAGSLEWDAVSNSVRLHGADGGSAEHVGALNRDEMLRGQLSAFLRAVGGGEAAPLATGEEGVKALAICDAARVSSMCGRAEPVRY